MRARTFGALLAALLMLGAAVAPVGAAKGTGEWHRLNPDPANVANEHERLTCREGAAVWTCFYDKLQDPGYAWNSTIGRFAGRDVTDSWNCPEWFPADACTGVVQVLRGPAVFYPDGGRPFAVGQEYILTDVGGTEVLYVHWIDRFVCPWYRTFDEAFAANPESDPDCTFAG